MYYLKYRPQTTIQQTEKRLPFGSLFSSGGEGGDSVTHGGLSATKLAYSLT